MTVILRSKATKNPKPLRDCCASCVHLDAHRSVDWDSRLKRRSAFPVIPAPERESRGGVWSPEDALDSSLRSE